MKIHSLLETTHDRKALLQLQQELIEELPEEYNVSISIDMIKVKYPGAPLIKLLVKDGVLYKASKNPTKLTLMEAVELILNVSIYERAYNFLGIPSKGDSRGLKVTSKGAMGDKSTVSLEIIKATTFNGINDLLYDDDKGIYEFIKHSGHDNGFEVKLAPRLGSYGSGYVFYRGKSAYPEKDPDNWSPYPIKNESGELKVGQQLILSFEHSDPLVRYNLLAQLIFHVLKDVAKSTWGKLKKEPSWIEKEYTFNEREKFDADVKKYNYKRVEENDKDEYAEEGVEYYTGKPPGYAPDLDDTLVGHWGLHKHLFGDRGTLSIGVREE